MVLDIAKATLTESVQIAESQHLKGRPLNVVDTAHAVVKLVIIDLVMGLVEEKGQV